MKLLWMVTLLGFLFGLAFAVASKLMQSRLGRLMFAVGCVLTVTAIFADVVSGFLGYRSLYTDIRDTGFFTNPYAMKMVAVALALICYLAVGEMMHSIFHGEVRQAVLYLVGWLIIFWSVMFGFTSDQLFSRDGPLKSYVELSNGAIVLQDISLVKTPYRETGRILKPLTPEVAEKYHQQQEQKLKHNLELEGGQLHGQSQKQPEQPNTQQVSNLALKHEVWLKKISVSFDSCFRQDNVVCTFSVTNTGDKDVKVRWKRYGTATDNGGNRRDPFCDIGGNWPTHRSGFFGNGDLLLDEFYETNLIPSVQWKLRAMFTDINQTVNRFQNLRLNVNYPGWLFGDFGGDDENLDFTDLPITNLVQSPAQQTTTTQSGTTANDYPNKVPPGAPVDITSLTNFESGKGFKIQMEDCSQRLVNIYCRFTVTNISDLSTLFTLSRIANRPHLTSEIGDSFNKIESATDCLLEGPNKLEAEGDNFCAQMLSPGAKIIGMVTFPGAKHLLQTLSFLKVRYQFRRGNTIEIENEVVFPLNYKTEHTNGALVVDGIEIAATTDSEIRGDISKTDWMLSRIPDNPELNVIRIKSVDGVTRVLVKARANSRLGVYNLSDAKKYRTNLEDDKGRIYPFREAGWIFKIRADGENIDRCEPDLNSVFHLEVGEAYLFLMMFEPLKDDVQELMFCSNGYSPKKLTRQLQELYSSRVQK